MGPPTVSWHSDADEWHCVVRGLRQTPLLLIKWYVESDVFEHINATIYVQTQTNGDFHT